jgi:phosphotransacetylase
MTAQPHEEEMMIKSFAELVERAQKLGPARVVVIEAHNPDVLESLKDAEPLGLAKPILVGNPAKIERVARETVRVLCSADL